MKITDKLELTKIYNENCLDTMAKMPDNFIDLTVTSPPYDNLRDYKGYSFPFEEIAKELFRVTKQGGIIVWVVGDATVNGSESGTSFKQALFFKEIGFNLHDTMIWKKPNPVPTQSTRYQQEFEYMFVFCKGKPKTFNPIRVKSKCAGTKVKKHRATKSKHNYNDEGIYTVADTKMIGNVWEISNVKNESGHPAIFPIELPEKHILTWSNETDLIYDPFMGSGTTAKMAILNKRKYIGSEISKEYCDIAIQRIKNHVSQQKLF
jgi:site-specific DNA-methyltransferase (adenine-specific)